MRTELGHVIASDQIGLLAISFCGDVDQGSLVCAGNIVGFTAGTPVCFHAKCHQQYTLLRYIALRGGSD